MEWVVGIDRRARPGLTNAFHAIQCGRQFYDLSVKLRGGAIMRPHRFAGACLLYRFYNVLQM